MLTNRQVADFVSVVRPFFALSDGEVRILEEMVRTELNRTLKTALAKRKEPLDFKEIKSIIEQQITSRNFLSKVAIEAKRIIYQRTKSGFGVSYDEERNVQPNLVRLSVLSRSYKLYRAGKLAFARSKYGHVYSYKPKDTAPILGEFGAPNRSNLTLTGQMLNAIRTRVTNGQASIYIDNNVRTKD